ncbi:MAG TPA: hypothetical protein VGJ84_17405 [Polyangiaceae bacterium]
MVKISRKTITIALSIATAHFFLTSVAGYYVGAYVGGQVGEVVAKGLIEVMEHRGEDAESFGPEVVRNMDNASEAILAPWKPFFAVIAFPAKPLLRPISSHFWRIRLEALRAKEISREQFRTETILLDLALSLLNSLVFGLLVFVALVPLRHNRAP